MSRPPALLPVMPWRTSCMGWLGQQQPLWGSRPDLFPASPFQAPGSLEPCRLPGRPLAWAGQRERPGPARASEGWDTGKIEALHTKLSCAGAKAEPGEAGVIGAIRGKRSQRGPCLAQAHRMNFRTHSGPLCKEWSLHIYPHSSSPCRL